MRILGSIPEVKKSALTNDWENIAYWEETEQREVLENKFSLSQIQVGGLGLVTTPEKFSFFSLF